MFDAKSFLDGLTKNLPGQLGQTLNSLGLGGAGQRQDQPLKQVNAEEAEPEPADLSQGLSQGFSGLADKAKELWQGQSAVGKTAIAGGLLGVLFTSGGRKLLEGGAKLGATGLIGGLAYKAYQDWQAGKAPVSAPVEVLPPPLNSAFLPGDQAAANDLSERILRAMIAAAKADGHISADERLRIDKALSHLGVGPEAQALISAELNAPLDAHRVAALARTPEEATEIYAATLLVVDEQSLEEKAYLAALASALNLDAELVKHIEARAANIA